ncbi:flagellar biosynthetic protein FliQ [Azospirillum fermentarium]|uniref:EscS/YscS/HrcS family type III secretion system export apparatus protein n=1 Tax=Azospirillum fermentarium TaxID=1233114 RepID=UPI002226AE0E|nr:flagellar biosynthetic protein FliQ [Azospirillum fermentarium]MCW2247175.1 flagellar biosynthetic protein FliQ [Azospirillum fermentarium]
MGIEDAISVTYDALLIIIKLSLPTLLITTGIGLVVTLFQSVTHIQDATIQQNLKIIGTIVILFISAPAIFMALRDFTLLMFDRMMHLP